MRPQPATMSPTERQIFADIAEDGVHIAHVDGSDGMPPWSFTVGLWHSFEHPEILVIGLPRDVAGDLLDNVADAIDGGRKFAAGEKHDGLVHGYPVTFGGVTAAQGRQWLALVNWAYERGDVPCLQLVYPDKQGRWPWQADVREGFRELQPVLERAAAEGSA